MTEYIYIRCVFLQLCQTLCDPMDCSLPATSVHRFCRQEYWSGLPCSPPGELPDPGIKPGSVPTPALAGTFFTSATWEAHIRYSKYKGKGLCSIWTNTSFGARKTGYESLTFQSCDIFNVKPFLLQSGDNEV